MPRTTDPVSKLASGRWQARYRDPSGAQRKRTFAKSSEARAFLDSVRDQVRQRSYIEPKDAEMTFGAFAQEWAASRDWKHTSREGWSSVYKRLAPLLGGRPLFTIDRLCLEGVQRELGERYARSTVTLTMSQAKSVMRAAYASGRIPRDPTVGIREPKVRAGEPDGRVGPEGVPTRAEVLALLGAAPPRFRAAIALGVTGLRVGEVLAVTADRLNLDRRHLLIDRQVQRLGNEVTFTTPKAEKERRVVLPSAVVLELRRHLRDHHEGEGVLFSGERADGPMRRDAFYASAWTPALVASGLGAGRFRFHALRHFAASSMLAEGAPITAVAGHLGDTVETVQRVYAHWLRDDREIPASVLDRVLNPATAGATAGAG